MNKLAVVNKAMSAAGATTIRNGKHELHIQIRRRPGGLRGCKDIIVNDEVWGHIEMFGRGSHGAHYQFMDSASCWCNVSTERGYRTFTVKSDSGATREALRTHPSPVPRVAPLETRLLEGVKQLIVAGRLKAPAELKAESEAREREREANAVLHATEEAARLLRKAREALPHLETDYDTMAKIVELMRWAQSQ